MPFGQLGERARSVVEALASKALPESNASQLATSYQDLRRKAGNGDVNSQDVLTFCGLADVDEDPVELDRHFIYFPQAQVIGHGHRRVPIAAQPLAEYFDSHPGDEARVSGLIEAKGLRLTSTERVEEVIN